MLAASTPDASGTLFGKFLLLKKLAAGGMGEVRLCHDRRVGRDVAIKTARPGPGSSEDEGRFLTEARLQGADRYSHAMLKGHGALVRPELLTALGVPPIHFHLVETIDPEGPFGAKEAGQGPLLPVIPAVANAVYNAVGVRIDEVPITPEKVLKAMSDRSHRVGPNAVPAFEFPPLVKADVPDEWKGR